MNAIGHNENAIRLAALAGDAQVALDKAARGEADAIEGWLAYGAALNEGRSLFKSDEQFGQWVQDSNLHLIATFNLKRESDAVCPNTVTHEVNRNERAAAMWAAANADQLAEAKANSKARTLRGWHDQWKKIEQEREAARQKAERDAEKKRLDEEAATARREAEEKAKAEKEAQEAIAAANTDEDREIAEAKAERVAVENAEAHRIAVEAESAAAKIEITAPEVDAETAVDQPEDDKIDHKLRRAFRKLTAQAQEDDWVGLKRAIHDEAKKRRAIEAENRKLKESLKLYRHQDQNAVIRALEDAKRNAENAQWRSLEEQQRQQKQIFALKKRVEELEGMEIQF